MSSPSSEGIARFRPWSDGVYRMVPAMRPLGADFGNGPLDAQPLIQDSQLEEYLEAKHSCPRRPLTAGMSPELEQNVLQELGFKQTLERAVYGIQEDLAVVQEDGTGSDRCVFLGVLFPSRWAPEVKIGKSFFAIHEEIPEMEKTNAGASGLVQAITQRGPYVRFVWSLETSPQLDLHPSVAPIRDFKRGELWARVERQVTIPIPSQRAAVFLIRIFRYPVEELTSADRVSMADAVEGMSEAVAQYKGVHGQRRELVARLRGQA